MADLHKRQLVSRARERVCSRELPDHEPQQSWGGTGSGQSCALCNLPITGSQIEYEIEAGGGSGTEILRFHAECSLAWRQACSVFDVIPAA